VGGKDKKSGKKNGIKGFTSLVFLGGKGEVLKLEEGKRGTQDAPDNTVKRKKAGGKRKGRV